MFKKWYLNHRKSELEHHHGVVIKNTELLSQLAQIKQLIIPGALVFYDGKPLLRQYFGVQDQTIATKQKVLQLAASLVQPKQHLILQSLRQACTEAGLTPREVEVDTITEMGVVGQLDRTWYILGDEELMNQEEIELGVTIQTLAQQFELDGKYVLFLAQKRPKRLLGIFASEYSIKPGSADTIGALRALGIEPILLTGAKTRIAKGLGLRLSISLIHSELTEQEKGQIIVSLVHQQPASAILAASRSGQKLPDSLTIGVEGIEGTITLEHLANLPPFLAEAQEIIHKI